MSNGDNPLCSLEKYIKLVFVLQETKSLVVVPDCLMLAGCSVWMLITAIKLETCQGQLKLMVINLILVQTGHTPLTCCGDTSKIRLTACICIATKTGVLHATTDIKSTLFVYSN